MTFIYLVPILLQGLLMMLDEIVFHQCRILPRWERIGHPIDTIFFVVPIIGLLFQMNFHIYVLFCTFSSLIITKDEFVHSQLCKGSEHWIHSVLFILHPITFFCLWKLKQEHEQLIILLTIMSIFVFLIYQLLYWRPWWDQKKLLTMKFTNN